MDLATAIAIAKKAGKVYMKAGELYRMDQEKRIVFKRDFVLGKFKDPVAIGGAERSVPDFVCDDFGIVDGVFEVFATADRAPFCDGCSLAPDKLGDCDLIKWAAGHDALYEYLEEIAAAWGWTEADVRELADGMFGDGVKHETSKYLKFGGSLVARCYYTAVRWFGGIYHKAKQSAPVVLCLLLLGAGCVDPPGIFEPSDDYPEYVVTNAPVASPIPAAAAALPPDAGPAAPAAALPADAADFSSLDWCWGGFDGSGAAPADGCRIKGLKVGGDVRYSWAEGGCEKLGAASATDADHTIACLFVFDGGRWRGGKFDWISTSRTSRDIKNIESGYNGWDAAAFRAAKQYAFCIVSADGKKRTNVIVAGAE